MIRPSPARRADELEVRALPSAGTARSADAPFGPEYAARPRDLREGGGWDELDGHRWHVVLPLLVDED